MDQRDILRSINWTKVEEDLLIIFSNRYRKMWVQFTRHGSICVTAFPLDRDQSYEIFTFIKIEDWSVENLTALINEKITLPN